MLPQSFWDRMETMNGRPKISCDTSSASRLHFWRVAVDMANDHPLLGVGYNAYNGVYNHYDFSVGFYGAADRCTACGSACSPSSAIRASSSSA